MTTVKTFLSRTGCLLGSRKSLVTQNQVIQTTRVIATPLHTSSSQRRTTVPEASQKSQLAALKERGLINTTVLRHVKSPGVKCLDIVNNGKHIDITWEDGHKSKFHAIWLRHSCHSTSSRLDHNGMICSKPEDIDLGIRVVSTEIEDNNEILLLKWHYSDGRSHEGPIPLAWLRNSCVSAEKDREDARAMTFFKEKTIPEVEYKDVMESDQGLYAWMCHLAERGICLVKNVPQVDKMIAKVTERIAPVQHTVYGEVFDVVSQAEPINAAYSNVTLAFHMDQCMYENPPGLQLLHCMQFDTDVTGGANTFADIFEIAHKLKAEKPEYFDTLTRIPVTMSTIHYSREYPVHMTCKRPLFSLNGKGELMSITYHPMLAEISPREADIEPFFEAYKCFWNMVQTCESVYSHRLERGDLISFNNRRVLHGRDSYNNPKGTRWLQGNYVELSEFQSRLQVFHNILGDGRPVTRLGMVNWE